MFKSSFIFLLSCIFQTVYPQGQIPIFQSKKDSIRFVEIQAQIQLEIKSGQSKKLDSLLILQTRMMREVAVRFRTIYVADKAFTTYSHLGDPQSVTRLSISNYKGTTLPDSIYLCINLVELELVNSKIQKIPAKLSGLTKLRKVTIYNNQPKTKLRLGKNSTLQELVIRGDEHGKLPGSYKKFKALKTLDLSKNGLSEFPRINNAKSIKKLVLLENNITLSTLKGKQSVTLEELNLTRNKIAIVPDALGNFTGLKKLNLNANQITKISQGVERLQNLEELGLYQNKLTRVPNAIYRLKHLKVIDLYFNQIEKLIDSLGLLQNLEILYLANNKLFTVPEQVGSLGKLRELYLHHNRLSSLPENIRRLDSLRVLRINNNLLVELPSSVYSLKKLENLDISFNQIHQLSEKLIEFPKLKLLVFANNPWESPTKESIPMWTAVLKSRNVIVNDYTPQGDITKNNP